MLGNVRASGIMVATYNHGWLEINGDVEARTLVIDDHHALIRGDRPRPGWTTRERDAGLGLPESDWRDEVRPEFVDEFFNADGDFKDGNWNISVVKAVIAGPRRPQAAQAAAPAAIAAADRRHAFSNTSMV